MSRKLYVVGFGPGDRIYMTEQAVEVLQSVDLIVGYTAYINLLKIQFPDQNFYATPMCREVERCRTALEAAVSGKNVAMVSSGDSGIYGMAGLVLEVAQEMQADVEVIMVPGVTAASAAAAVLGAPLMHDFAVVSLSDCMTPLDQIYRRVALAAQADFVICLYNPKSKLRTEYLAKAAKLIGQYRDLNTPVGIVRNAGRADQKMWLTSLEKLKDEPVDMFCVVIIGNSKTYCKNGKMITPRGYYIEKRENKWEEDSSDCGDK